MDFLRTPVAGGNVASVATPPSGDARTDIRSSFQSLFPSATPGPDHGFSYPSLTPFLGAMTPAVAHGVARGFPPATGSNTPGLPQYQSSPPASSPDMVQLTSPYLQAAAKEAVRREFMSMPGYAAAASSSSEPEPQSLEQTVPGNDHARVSKTPAPQPAASQPYSYGSYPGHTQYPGMFFMPYPGMSAPGVPAKAPEAAAKPPGESVASAEKEAKNQESSQAQQQQHHQQQQQQMAAAAAAMGGMMVMGPMGPMMLPSYGYPAGQPMAHPHLMMMQPHPAAAPPPSFGSTGLGGRSTAIHKNETPSEKKVRIEAEKQDLIREFKKKTREAALVRFRQKRRERRFGKLIRYDCRKVLAEKRPRVKGRFVRVKDDDEHEDFEDSVALESKRTESSLSGLSNDGLDDHCGRREEVCSPDSMSQVVPGA